MDIDLKMLSKILALRMEKILPSIINGGQTEFIKGRSCSHNIKPVSHVIRLQHVCSVLQFICGTEAHCAFTLDVFTAHEPEPRCSKPEKRCCSLTTTFCTDAGVGLSLCHTLCGAFHRKQLPYHFDHISYYCNSW